MIKIERKRWLLRSSLSKYSLLLFLGLICLTVNACVLDAPLDPPSPVTPDTTFPSTLQVTVNIDDNQNASDGKSLVTLQFKTNEIHEDNYVIFTHGEKVNCNNHLVTLNDAVSYPIPMNKPRRYWCKYLWNSRSFPIIAVRARTRLEPKLTMPVINNYLKISYTSDEDPHDCQIQVVASDALASVSNGYVPDQGKFYNGPDVSSLNGPGNLVMTRTCKFPLMDSNNLDNNPDFNIVNITYTSTAALVVKWSP